MARGIAMPASLSGLADRVEVGDPAVDDLDGQHGFQTVATVDGDGVPVRRWGRGDHRGVRSVARPRRKGPTISGGSAGRRR